MLLAIGLKSRFIDRRQLVGKPPEPTGPAKSFHGCASAAAAWYRAFVCMRLRATRQSCFIRPVACSQTIRPSGMLSRMMMRLPLAGAAASEERNEAGDVEAAWQLYLWHMASRQASSRNMGCTLRSGAQGSAMTGRMKTLVGLAICLGCFSWLDCQRLAG